MKNNCLEIEPLHRADIDSLQPLVSEFVQTHPSLPFRENYWSTFENWLAKGLDDPDSLGLLARINDGAVGLIVGDIRENGPLLWPDHIGHVSVLVVAHTARMQGIGDSLWRALHNWFMAKGIHHFELYTEYGNILSGPFWDRRGFEIFLEKRRLSDIA